MVSDLLQDILLKSVDTPELIPYKYGTSENAEQWPQERIFHEFFGHIVGDPRPVEYLVTRYGSPV